MNSRQSAQDGESAYGQRAGFFSSSGSFNLPVGQRFDRSGTKGYYIDFTRKAEAPTPKDGDQDLHVVAIQYGLGAWEAYLAHQLDSKVEKVEAVGQMLLRVQERSGPLAGGWPHLQPFPHTYALRPPWHSAMAQGEAASLLVRLHRHTGDDRYAEAASLALGPLRVAASQGGCRTELRGYAFYEEYPTSPPSFVLNGLIFAIWGLHDVAMALGDDRARDEWQKAVEMLLACLPEWDLGWWSLYDLHPHPMRNVASSFYHRLHSNQLRSLAILTGESEFSAMAQRFDDYALARRKRWRAFAHKAWFRLRVPRRRAPVPAVS